MNKVVLFACLFAICFLIGIVSAEATGNESVLSGDTRSPVQPIQDDEAIMIDQFSGGSGTLSDPYLVGTAADLNQVRNHPDKHFRQVAAINLGVSPWISGGGWVPIGTYPNAFTGSYDGNGYAIKGMVINRPDTWYQGLFGSTRGATLRNIYLQDIMVKAGGRSGGLAGLMENTKAENIRVTGRVESDMGNIGGFAGRIERSRLHYVSAAVDVVGIAPTGGLAGHIDGEVRHSFSGGSVNNIDFVTGISSVGGFAGTTSGDTIISDCYSHAWIVKGERYVGGFVGQNSGSIYRSYSTGGVVGLTDSGGFIGNNYGGVRDCYWDIQGSGKMTSAGGEGKTRAEMQQQATFQNYNFFSLWQMNGGYPEFRDLMGYPDPIYVPLSSLAGSGTQVNPYIITTGDELNAIRQDVTAHYRLGNDLDLTSTVAWDLGRGWEPVGSTGSPFTGTLDGNGHRILHLTLNKPGTQNQGLFGVCQGSTIQKLIIEDSNIQGGDTSGGLTGIFNNGILHLVSCDGVVLGGASTGGMIGEYQGEMRHSYTKGSVSGSSRVGGVAGKVLPGSIISDCYSHASVRGDTFVGGFAGESVGSIYRSYSAGMVTGVSSTGGFLALSSGLARDCYWDTISSGQSTSAGGTGVAGRTTAEMKLQATFPHYNFFSLWQMNGGYPEFMDLMSYPDPVDVSLNSLAGVGTTADPYIIRNVNELNAVRKDVSAHYRFGSDIDLTPTVAWDLGRGFEPIGSTGDPFTGSLENLFGEVHLWHGMSNLVISRPGADYMGLFGVSDGARFERIAFENLSLQAGDYCGAVTGLAEDSDFRDIFIDGAVVQGDDYSGVMAGNLGFGNEIRSVGVKGIVLGNRYVGGIAGAISDAGTMINNCYSRVDVTGGVDVGGLVGDVRAAPTWISHSYSTGRVTGTGGGFIGASSAGVTYSGCYWDTESSEKSASAGNADEVMGRTTAQMTYPHDGSTTYRNWDFTAVWAEDIDYPQSRNDGYPYLTRVTPGPTATITVTATPTGAGIVTGGGNVTLGGEVTVTATPNAGWEFKEWREGGSLISSQPAFTFVVTRDRNLEAVFIVAPIVYNGVFRHGEWIVHDPITGTAQDRFRFGLPTDIPFVINGDAGVYRNGEWIIRDSATGGVKNRYWFGLPNDIPVVINGNAGVYRKGEWIIRDPATGEAQNRFWFGGLHDYPVVINDQPAIFWNGRWLIRGSSDWFDFGASGDRPFAIGDTVAVYRNGEWIIRDPITGGVKNRYWFGLPHDIPVCGFQGPF